MIGHAARARRAARWLGLALLFTGVTAVVTWPQIRQVQTGIHDYGDPLLNAWALTWIAHALVTPDAALLDANIFYPERSTLALSETLVFPGILVAPLRWLGAGPVTLHNVTLFSAFVLSGLFTFLLVESLTGDWRGALVAGVAFTVTPLRLEQYAHLQLQLTYLMPLGLYLLHRLFKAPSRALPAVLLGLTVAAQFYSCVYYAIYLATLLALLVPLRWFQARPPLREMLPRLLLAAAVAAAALSPVVPAYMRNRAAVGERSMEDLVRGSAELRDYARATPLNRLYGDPSRPGPGERHLFPGYSIAVLSATALAGPAALAVPYGSALILAFDASRGTHGYVYPLLHRYLLPYRALRVPARLAMVVVLLMAVLAGIGVSKLFKVVRSRPVRAVVLTGALLGLLVEGLKHPLPWREMPPEIPEVYHWLRDMPSGPVLEYPVGPLGGRVGPQDPAYMFFSTLHWRPLLNGYSGFAPPSYHELLQRMADFPAADSIAYLQQRRVRYLLVHEGFYVRDGFREDVAGLEARAELRRLAEFVNEYGHATIVYEVTPAAVRPGRR